jgi:uncharacterized glyoxalase superfamily protein PhnB
LCGSTSAQGAAADDRAVVRTGQRLVGDDATRPAAPTHQRDGHVDERPNDGIAVIHRPKGVTMTQEPATTSIESVALEVSDPVATEAFYAALGVGTRVDVRASTAPTSGFRGVTLSLVVSQPSTVDSVIGAALDAGATPLKPVGKSFWGYGGVVRAPDRTIWKVATSSKKDTGPANRQIDDMVLLLGVADVKGSKRFYIDRGLTVARGFGSKYVQFEARST